ncbi:MAG: nuclear transport factor 2 family protein [Phaeodactylibacter sp.]|nr:nuclear transport factor 2 family protein [Phaeodactylibacter sp.]
MKLISSISLCLIFIVPAFGQQEDSMLQELFEELKAKDSLIFKLGFNECDTAQLRALLSDDLEFYHDQSGIMDSKEAFIQNVPNLCKMEYKPIRELVEGSLEVFPLYSNGNLYGAIQKGVHEFYGEEPGKPKYLTSTAKFTHVWIIENDEWRLKRVLSYDHQSPDNWRH